MIERMTGAGAISAGALSEEVGVAQSTLSYWLREAAVSGSGLCSQSKRDSSEVMMNRSPKRPKDWTAEDKLNAVLKAASLSEAELGAFLRREGLHETHLRQWRSRMLEGLHGTSPAGGKAGGKSPEAKRIRQLERELTRKDKALAEAAALLVLKKKVQAIWGDEDNDTAGKNGR